MHIKLSHSIQEGDVYFVAFPRFAGAYDWNLPPCEHWNETSVMAVRPPRTEDGIVEDFFLERIENIPLGTTALILKEAGVGPYAQQLGQWHPSLGAAHFFECLVTIEGQEPFVAVLGVTELWFQNPLKEKHSEEWPMPEYDVGPKAGYPEDEEDDSTEESDEDEEDTQDLTAEVNEVSTLNWAQNFLDDIEHGSPVSDWAPCLPELVQDLVTLLTKNK